MPARRTEQREASKPREQPRSAAEQDRGDRRRKGRGRDERDSGQRGSEGRRHDQRQRGPEREKPERSTPSPASGSSVAPPPPKARPVVEAEGPTEPAPRPPQAPHTEARPVAEETGGAVPAEMDGPTREEVRKRAEAALAEVLRRMGFEARVSSFYDEQESEIVIAVDSEAEGLLIGRRGQTLDALEHVINRIVLAGETAAEGRLAIDVGGYRQRRRETLLELADRLKVRALTQGRRIQVSPMSPRDRRILQAALGRDETVRMRVLGSGFYRRVVIFPVGLDETAGVAEVETEDLPGGEPLEADDEQV
jgi:spoIIIJ-associated protein